jgi:hypothetical protein
MYDETGLDPDEIQAAVKFRQEIRSKPGLEGFKRGGRVKKTGVYKLHRGERVVKAATAKKRAPVRAVRKSAASSRGRRK